MGKKKSVKSKEGMAIGTNKGVVNVNDGGVPLTPEEIQNLELRYLNRLDQDCEALDWLASVRYQDEKTPPITLDTIYTGLLTTSLEGDAQLQERVNKESRQLSVVEVLNQHKHLVLTGAPGGGKSAFVNYLALCLSGERQEDAQRNIHTLTEPMPDEDGKPQEKPQPWNHGGLLPIRIILRDFTSSTYFPGETEAAEASHLLDFIKAELKRQGLSDYYPVLKKQMGDGKVVVMLDGLDEVPEAGKNRERMVECVHNFKKSYATCRILVTCRPYAYEKTEWQIPGFTEFRLADFEHGQIIRFVDRWYASRAVFEESAKINRSKDLKKAIFERGREALQILVKRPLLLTMTAYLHAYGGQDLPQQRAGLYEELLKLLIDKWESARFKGKDAQTLEKLQPSLAEYLKVDSRKIRLILERLAFSAHASQPKPDGTADIPAEKITHQLKYLAKEEGLAEISTLDKLGEYLSERVGILYQRGGDSELNAIFTFPHRSFQEYLAASYFSKEEDSLYSEYDKEAQFTRWYELAAHLVATDPDRWREVVLLAGGIKADTDQGAVGDLIDALYPEDNKELTTEQAWGLRLAGEILAENLKRNTLNRRNKRIAKRVKQALPRLFKSQLNAEERVAAGRHLASIGDFRQQVMDVDVMQFCYIPEGDFYLGDREQTGESFLIDNPKGAADYTINKPYWLSRYPVSVAQFRQFLESDIDFDLGDMDCLKAPDNTPAVYVSWYQAIKFCSWLEKRWKQQGWLPEHYRVALPSEPEWEKAAKGGYKIPLEVVSSVISDLSDKETSLRVNHLPKRYYTWGDDEDAERMNYAMSIGKISSLGVYPDGQSPYGCEDMSGNVWEWTRSKRDNYPYPDDAKGLGERESSAGSAGRVLRGGAFFSSRMNARCSFRYGAHPVYRNNSIGFRIAVSPLL